MLLGLYYILDGGRELPLGGSHWYGVGLEVSVLVPGAVRHVAVVGRVHVCRLLLLI